MIKNITRRMVCLIPGGLKVMNAVLIAKTVKIGESHVIVECKHRRHVAHDICGILSMGVGYGDMITITACGEDAEEIIRNVGILLHEDTEDVLNPIMHSDTFQMALT